VVKGLAMVKENYDSGVFQAIQEAGVAALTGRRTALKKCAGCTGSGGTRFVTV